MKQYQEQKKAKLNHRQQSKHNSTGGMKPYRQSEMKVLAITPEPIIYNGKMITTKLLITD